MKTHIFSFKEILGKDDILTERKNCHTPTFMNWSDDAYLDNLNFDYMIFEPDFMRKDIDGKASSFIFLFHGLNERTWDKYISWAEKLANLTKKAIVLFPIAFHINRSPKDWFNPRVMQSFVNQEELSSKTTSRLSFLNFALSYRIKADPYRFYLSGKETINNICQLIEQVKLDKHSFISKDAHYDIFAYSIGALLSQVMIQANPLNYFDKSKLFMFCGGSLFNKMNGESKMIMDKESFEHLTNYYQNYFKDINRSDTKHGAIESAFISMIDAKFNQSERESFYKKACNRIRAISLKKDTVIPTSGIKLALGDVHSSCLEEMDFTYKYSHEMPFPVLPVNERQTGEYWFNKVFSKAGEFLS